MSLLSLSCQVFSMSIVYLNLNVFPQIGGVVYLPFLFARNALQRKYAQAPVLLPEAETWVSSLLPPHKYPTGVEFYRFSHCLLFPACFSLSPGTRYMNWLDYGSSPLLGLPASRLSLPSAPHMASTDNKWMGLGVTLIL